MNAEPPRFPDDLFGPRSPLHVIGHRGAAGVAPENTLPSFRRAVQAGADAVELDLHTDRTGELVVIHDDTVERTTDGAGSVESMGLEDLRRLDAGYRFSPDQGESFPFRGQGLRIPTLDEVLSEVPGLPVIAEIKSARAGVALGNWLVESPDANRILVGGFSRRQVEPAGRRARWRCAYTEELRGYVLLGKLGLARLAVPEVDAAMVPERRRMLRVVTPRFVRQAHADGLGVFVWTVNRPGDARRLFGWGVNGLVSDFPSMIRRIVEERQAVGQEPGSGSADAGADAGAAPARRYDASMESAGARSILHVDMDAFFAAVEAREDPSLRGKPVVVGSDPREGGGRGVVAAASYEAREYGIASAMPISRAWRLCPHAVYLRPRGSLYARVSERILEILRRYTDQIEPLSLDEAFLDVTASRSLFGSGGEIARSIKGRIRQRERLTASVGVAASKFVAKLASDLEKPDGLVVVPAASERDFIAPLEIERLWGAGPRARERFRRLGVATIGEVAALPRETLVRAFGEARGRAFWRLSRGIDDRPVIPDRARKSLGRETTFPRDVADRTTVEAALLSLCDQVAHRLRRRSLAGTTVMVKVRWEGFDTVTRQATLRGPTCAAERIWATARRLFREADRGERRVRLVGVSVSGLGHAVQLSLFSDADEPASARAARALDLLAARFGEGAVTRAALLER